MDWIVVVVRRVVIRDCVPSRATAWSVVFREVRGRDSSEEIGGRGFGSVAARWARE